MAKLTYLKGDAICGAEDSGNTVIIPHICNNIGGWGRGFVIALSNTWPQPEEAYRAWAKNVGIYRGLDILMPLGDVQFVAVNNKISVANMIGQHDVRWKNGIPPIRLDAVKRCLVKVRDKAKEIGAEIHAPRFGSGLAGASWESIEEIILDVFQESEIPIYIYSLET